MRSLLSLGPWPCGDGRVLNRSNDGEKLSKLSAGVGTAPLKTVPSQTILSSLLIRFDAATLGCIFFWEKRMALETLKGIEKIDGFNVVVMDELREKYPERFNEDGAMQWEWFENEIRPRSFIYMRHDKNSLSFTLQNGPVKENGVNGCQIDTLIAACFTIVKGLNAQMPCPENEQVIAHLLSAYDILKKRKEDREKRGVEGTNEA